MKTAIISPLLLCLHRTQGFAPSAQLSRKAFVLHQTSTNDSPPIDVEIKVDAKENLLSIAEQLKRTNGFLIVDSTAKKELNSAVKSLEAEASFVFDESDLLGEWDLVCSTSTSDNGIDTSQFPDPLQQVRDRILKNTNQYLTVKQLIRSSDEAGKVERIDNVLSYEPPSTLQDVLDNVPEAIQKLNLNPLNVSKSKVSLIHKAQVESDNQVKLDLKSVVWNVAGTSKKLDPDGADIAGINLPFGEFRGGKFATTYMDDTLRISRGKQGLVDQLRVFVKVKGASATVVEEEKKDEEEEDAMEAVEKAVDLVMEEAAEAADEILDDITKDEKKEEKKEEEEEEDDGGDAPSDVE